MRDAELFVDALLVRVDGLGADGQLPADLGRRVTLRGKPQDILFTLGEPTEPVAILLLRAAPSSFGSDRVRSEIAENDAHQLVRAWTTADVDYGLYYRTLPRVIR